MSKEEAFWILLVFIAIILLCLWTATEIIDAQEQGRDYNNFITNEQTCPKCNWTGYAGAMRIVNGGFGQYDHYYCPECGYLMGEY